MNTKYYSYTTHRYVLNIPTYNGLGILEFWVV